MFKYWNEDHQIGYIDGVYETYSYTARTKLQRFTLITNGLMLTKVTKEH
jgi:hypothetical protein